MIILCFDFIIKIQEEIAKIWFVVSVNDIENPKCLTTIDFNGNVKTISYQDFVNDLNHYEMNPPYTITTQGVSIYIEKDDYHIINQLENHLPLFTHCVYLNAPKNFAVHGGDIRRGLFHSPKNVEC